MLKKGLFSVAPAEAPEPPPAPVAPVTEDPHHFEELGFKGALKMRGQGAGLSICLNRLYQEFMADARGDAKALDKEEARVRGEIEERRGKMKKHLEHIQNIREKRVPALQRRAEALGQEVRDIKRDPTSVRADAPSPVSFYVGLVIVACLTVYLFVFYSSATYSAFFKEFNAEEIAVANSIFDAQAFSKALGHGAAELLLILMMPFVFIGLGFLIHKFQEQRGATKYIKVGTLVAVTFVFDAILAYEITHKIYEIKALAAFQTPQPYTLADAAVNVQFWLIIFAGFVVYLIWGFVFDFTMEEHEKLDAVRLAVRSKNAEIESVKGQVKELEARADTLDLAVGNLQTEIGVLETKKTVLTVDAKEFKDRVSQFMEGWVHWLKANKYPDAAVHEAVRLRDEFLSNVLAPIAQSGDGASTTHHFANGTR